MSDYYETDDYFIARGIGADVAAARGYVRYDDENWREVLQDTYGVYEDDKELGHIYSWAEWVMQKVGIDYIYGYTVPRYSPPGFKELTTGLKFQGGEVRLGLKRHYHGTEVPVFALLPTRVELAFAVPGPFGEVYVAYDHKHEGMSESELAEHVEAFHKTYSLRKDQQGMYGVNTPKRVTTVHAHSFYVVPEGRAKKHIAGKTNGVAGKGPHKGENMQTIHVHPKSAKCVYSSSSSGEPEHMGFGHDHDSMTLEELTSHLEKYGFHEEDEPGE